MSDSGEMRGVVFALTFIIVFSAFVLSIPVELQGSGTEPDIPIPVDPALVSDFADSTNFSKNDFSGTSPVLYYYYDNLGGYNWECDYYNLLEEFSVGAKVYFFGWLWLGGLSYCNFMDENGTSLGTSVSFDDIDDNAEDGAARFDLIFADTGNSAGGFIFYWNTTAYADSKTAWNADGLELVHGVGFETTAVTNVGMLLLQLLFLQLPDTPILINIVLATPIWAMVVYLLWYILVKTTPFLG